MKCLTFVVDYRVSFEFDQPIRISKTRHLHNCVRRPNLAKELAMNCSDCFPILDAHQKSARANHVSERCAGLLQGTSDYLEASPRLRPGISHAQSAAIWTEWCGTGDCNDVADTRSP